MVGICKDNLCIEYAGKAAESSVQPKGAVFLEVGVATLRFRPLLFSIFAELAVCSATAGVYGVLAYTVGQRSSEIGLRMGLGASTRNVLRFVLGRGLTLASMGLVLSLAGAIGATRLLRTMPFDVKPDIRSLLLGIVTLVASYVPARQGIEGRSAGLSTKREPIIIGVARKISGLHGKRYRIHERKQLADNAR